MWICPHCKRAKKDPPKHEVDCGVWQASEKRKRQYFELLLLAKAASKSLKKAGTDTTPELRALRRFLAQR